MKKYIATCDHHAKPKHGDLVDLDAPGGKFSNLRNASMTDDECIKPCDQSPITMRKLKLGLVAGQYYEVKK